MTPAMGMEPMKPMTTIRFDFIKTETPNAECGKHYSEFDVRRLPVRLGPFGVRRLLSS